MDPLTLPGPGKPPVASRCLGCVERVLPGPHDCGGSRIPTDELGWWCDCPNPECRRRQAGDWTKPTTGVHRRRPGARSAGK